MACLALSLQPINGPDILLQTREWFPPFRALAALASFRLTRLSFSSHHRRHRHSHHHHHHHLHHHLHHFYHHHSHDHDATKPPLLSDDLDSSSLGDDPLVASSGHLIVGVESKYRIIYRLVNSIYVLAVATIDLANLFDCTAIINQAVSVIVVACRGVDVTADKINRKYAEIYMALDIVLRGTSGIRLAYILATLHGDGLAKMVQAPVGAEACLRGADAWEAVDAAAAARQGNVSILSGMFFELPPQALEAGDECTAALAPTAMGEAEEAAQEAQLLQENLELEDADQKDPFAASDAFNNPELLVGGFKKSKDPSGLSDVSMALAGLDVTQLPPPAATQSTFIGVEGFEGEYGGIEFSNEDATLKEAFEGFDGAFGGGLDASEFVGPTKIRRPSGLGGLEELQTAAGKASSSPAAAGPPEMIAKATEQIKGPQMYIVEVINAEFRESPLARVGLRGIIYLRTIPPRPENRGAAAGAAAPGGAVAETEQETQFSFGIEGTGGIKRAMMHGTHMSSVGNGMFHVRARPAEDPIPLLKYSLQPKHTPLPLRVRLLQRRSGTLLSLMIQYSSNPELPAPLTNVTFVLKLPADPTLLKVSPKAVLNRAERELRWEVEEIPLKGPPRRLRVRMPVEVEEEEIDVIGTVRFCMQGSSTLSGLSLQHPVSNTGKPYFCVLDHRSSAGVYTCCSY